MTEDILHREDFKHVVALISDTHVGSRYGLAGPNWKGKEGNPLKRNEGQKKIYDFWEETWVATCNKWKVDAAFLLGDLVNGYNRIEHGIMQMTTDLDEQIDHTETLLHPILDPIEDKSKIIAVSGSGYHESWDYRIHKDLVQRFGGKYIGSIGNVKFKDSKKVFNIAHGSSAAWVYRTMIMSRDAIFMMEAMHLGKIPKVDMIIRGHWHKFCHIHEIGIHIVQVPAWQAFVPWKGAIRSYGKFQPDLGGALLFIDKNDRTMVHHYTMWDNPHIGDLMWDL